MAGLITLTYALLLLVGLEAKSLRFPASLQVNASVPARSLRASS